MRNARFVVFRGSVFAIPEAAKEHGAEGGVIFPSTPKKKIKRCAAMGSIPLLIRAGAARIARIRYAVTGGKGNPIINDAIIVSIRRINVLPPAK